MSSATIGALRAVFGADTAAFEKGTDKVAREIKRTERNFKKMGERTKRIGSALSIGFTAPLALIGISSTKAGKDHREAMAQVEAGLKSMGSASGKTSAELKKSAIELEGLSNFNADEVLRKVTANMLTFGNVSGTTFDRAQQAALDLSERLDQDLKASTIAVGKALNDPVLGLTALSRVGIQFSEQQKKMVKDMVAAGNAAGAQNIILKELEKQYAGSAKAAQDAVPGSDLEDAYARFGRIIGEFSLKILPPLTAALTRVLDGFNNLSPGMQKTIVIAAAVLAAIGPLVAGIGTLMTVLAPLSAAFAVLSGATALGGTAAALIAILGPIGLVAAGLTALYMGYKTLSPAIRDNKKARDELYGLIGDNKSLLDRERATTLEGARAQLKEAEAIRENIKARLEQQELLLKKQARAFVALNSNPVGRAAGQLGLNKKIAENMAKTGRAVKAARDALLDNERASIDLQKRYKELGGEAVKVTETTVVLTKEQEAAAKAAKKRSSDIMAAHKSAVASTKEEIENNARLTAALKVSQREYELTAETIRLVEDGYTGTAEAARVMAGSILDSRAAMEAAQNAADLEREAVEKATEETIRHAEELARAAAQAASAHNDVVTSIEEEIANNALLVEALRVSQAEYDIVAEKIRILQGGFQGTGEEARAMAEKVVASRDTLTGLQEEARKTAAELAKTGATGVDAFTNILGAFQGLINGIKAGDLGSIASGIGGALGSIFGKDSTLGKLGGAVGAISSIFSKGSSSSSSSSDTINGFAKPSFETQGSSLSPIGASSFASSAAAITGRSSLKIELQPSPLFEPYVDKRAASVAAPIAEVTTVKGVSSYNQYSGKKSRQSLTRRGR